MTTTLTLATLPPSANIIWRTGKRGTYRNPKYVAWLEAEGLLLKSQLRGQKKYDAPVYVKMELRRPRKNSDLDNRLKGTGDLLQAIGAITDDKLIIGWIAYWADDLPKGVAAEITIFSIAPNWWPGNMRAVAA